MSFDTVRQLGDLHGIAFVYEIEVISFEDCGVKHTRKTFKKKLKYALRKLQQPME